MELSVVIPVYRSAPILPGLIRRLTAALGDIGKDYELILVEDGSPDDTWAVLEGLQKQAPDRLIAVQLMRNFGQHNALMCGFRHAQGQIIVTLDDDLQNPPEEIPKLLKALHSHDWDLAYGMPEEKKHGWWRNLGSRLVISFYRLVFRTEVTPTSFRAIRRPLLDSILTYNLNFTYIDGLLAWNTQRIGEVRVEHQPRTSGRSGYSLGRLLGLALNLFTNFSLLPLQMVSLLGLVAAAGGLATAVFYLLRYFQSSITVPGYASTIIAVLVLGGVQLLALGIMGEYLGRLHLNVNRKPQYFERQVLGRQAAARTSFDSAEARGET